VPGTDRDADGPQTRVCESSASGRVSALELADGDVPPSPIASRGQYRVGRLGDHGHMRVPPFTFELLYQARRAYWRIAKPTTYGVKALVIHPNDFNRVLLVRHSYGDQSLWRLPGGGYKPTRETPEQAARRECIEELGIESGSSATVLEEHLTASESKQGHLKIVRLSAISEETSPNGEIAEARWTAVDLTDLPGNVSVSKWVYSALEAHAKG
jgi:8-oxo-dGTP diphosphatase